MQKNQLDPTIYFLYELPICRMAKTVFFLIRGEKKGTSVTKAITTKATLTSTATADWKRKRMISQRWKSRLRPLNLHKKSLFHSLDTITTQLLLLSSR